MRNFNTCASHIKFESVKARKREKKASNKEGRIRKERQKQKGQTESKAEKGQEIKENK
jgi:hypothetical protein